MDKKRCIKKLREDIKTLRKGGRRRNDKFLLDIMEELTVDQAYNFCVDQNLYVTNAIKEERERAYQYSIDDEEATKYGFYTKKQKEEQILAWSEQAYPNINVGIMEIQFEIQYIEGIDEL
jgi:hypothetical protein